MEAGVGQQGRWTGTTTASAPMVVFLVLVLAGTFVLVYRDAGWVPSTAFITITAVVLVTFLYARTEIDARGLRVHLGPFGWPTVSRSAEEITSAKIVHVRWWMYGLGYRLIWKGTAVVPRGGEGVELSLRNGRRFIFTTADAGTALQTVEEQILAGR